MARNKVLIVDDEKDILDLLEYNLEKEGYEVLSAMDGEEAISMAKTEKPNMVLLDIMMPQMDGIETCRRLRELPELKGTFIVFLTARAEEYSELAGFDAGADDYIAKPIKPRVLLSRIKAILRRDQTFTDEQDLLNVKDLEIIRDEYIVRRGNEIFNLPRKEFELLYFLASKPGKVFRREKLLEKIWGDVYVVDRTIDVHIRKLREKIGEGYIQTVKGVGYKFAKEK
ncbi:MAG: response regulator transcription factor [Bacteroidia bacterium]|nr:response regulator transcription factor [Bacteroidia bacterium]